jgi:uncharacterized protein (TIGR03382 family)
MAMLDVAKDASGSLTLHAIRAAGNGTHAATAGHILVDLQSNLGWHKTIEVPLTIQSPPPATLNTTATHTSSTTKKSPALPALALLGTGLLAAALRRRR